MPLNPSPRKTVPLSSGDDGPSRRPPLTFTKRAFFCGVVVEGPNDGADLSEDVQDLVASLGDKIPSDKDYDPPTPTPAQPGIQTRPRALTNTSALADLINELVSTERTYVQRLRILKNSYADPLRAYSKSKDTQILGPYDAKTMFGNIDYLVPANEAFLGDLEKMIAPNGFQTVGGIGDVALQHFKELRAFECYKQYYVKREEAQTIFKREMAKRSNSGFSAFVERIKYSSNDAKNRVGLRELLMEPVQRIPRYTLLFELMIKLMGASDPQRAKLLEANEAARKIALAEADRHTRLAATLNSLAMSIEGFPPALISSSRRFIDSIDVLDNLANAAGMNSYGGGPSMATGSSTPMSSSGPLHCTLFLFDDKLMIVKRPGTDKSGRSLAGLDDAEKLANSGIVQGKTKTLPMIRRNGMSCRGVVDITSVNATDVSGADMHLYLENPPLDQTDRWAGRPFRVLSTVLPGATYQEPSRLEREKKRFLENLWRVQARYRTRHGQSVALIADEQEVESRGGRVTIARTYFNVYQRTMFLKEAKKTKVVLHIDSLGNADPLPFGIGGPPYVVIRVQPMPGELCRYSVRSCDPNEEPDEDVVQSSRVPERVVQTIHQFGLFKFKTDNPSRPATPSGGNRSRAHIFGLDVISRNLFGSSRSKDTPSDSMGRHHLRSKTTLSRTSTLGTESSGTITTADSSTRYSQRTYSTAATSVSSFAVDDSSIGKRSTKSKKLLKRNRSKSPAGTPVVDSDYVSDDEAANQSFMRRRAQSMSSVPRTGDSIEYSDHEDADTTMLDFREQDVTESEMDLSRRLQLAKRNSARHGKMPSHDVVDLPVEDAVYEDEPPEPAGRPASRASHLSRSGSQYRHDTQQSPHYTTRSITPTPGRESPRKGRSDSLHSNRDRPPFGPREPSPLPPTSLGMNAMQIEIEGVFESTLARLSPEKPPPPEDTSMMEPDFEEGEMFSSTVIHDTPSRLPRSRRGPFGPLQSTPKGRAARAARAAAGIEPLSIKKKTPASTSLSPRKAPAGFDTEPEERTTRQKSDSYRSSAEPRITDELDLTKDLVQLSKRTREDLESSQRAVKRIKLETSAVPKQVMSDSPKAPDFRTIPRGLTPTSSRTNAATKEAQQRMEEMRALIQQRYGGSSTPRSRPKSVIETSQGSPQNLSHSASDATDVQSWAKYLDELASHAEDNLNRATDNYSRVEDGITRLVAAYQDDNKNLDKALFALEDSRHQCENLQETLSIVTGENEMLYDEFNGELERLFQEVTLPTDEAWVAMSADLNQTKKDRHLLYKENSDLKRQLREVEAQCNEWAALLRQHGLIS